MIILKIIILLLHFTLVPAVIGRLITYRSSLSCNHNPFVVYIVGFFGELSTMYVINTIVSFYQDFTQELKPVRGCFRIICFVFGAMLLVALLAYVNKFLIGDVGSESDDEDEDEPIVESEPVEKVRKQIRSFNWPKGLEWVYLVVFLGMVLFQLYFAYGYEINQWSYDDYDYVVHSVDNIANDRVDVTHVATGAIPSSSVQRMSASWTTFISYLSVVSRLDVATICHTCLPMILLIVVYIAYYYLAQCLFSKREDRFIFMCLLSMGFMFGLYTHYSITFRVLCAIWQGKAVLSAISIPFLIAYLPKVYRKKKFRNILPVFVVSLGTCSLTMMSTVLLPIMAVAMFVTLCIYKKKIVGVIPTILCCLGPVIQVIIMFTFKVFSVL